MKNPAKQKDNRGVALIIVIVVLAVFSIVIAALLFQAYTDRLVSVNEQDHIKTLTYADAGLSWAERRAMDAVSFDEVLNGPDNGSSGDDFLVGIRDLTLTATSQFTTANQGTKSAIVTRDFGDGSKTWEVLQLPATLNTRAHVYVRVDDTWDDDPADPSNNDPLIDVDGRIVMTAVAEYPIFVNGVGTPQANLSAKRARSIRRVRRTSETRAAASPRSSPAATTTRPITPRFAGTADPFTRTEMCKSTATRRFAGTSRARVPRSTRTARLSEESS